MRRTWINLYVHLVWCTSGREPLITEEIERRLFRYIESVCRKKGCVVQAIGGMSDHVHLCVSIPATLAIAVLMESVKGSSSHFVSHELHPGKWL